MKLNANYHTHTFRCKHAEGDVSDYCRAAVEAGLNTLGITDHTPLPDNRWLGVRMHADDLGDYIAAVRRAQREFPALTVLLGMECEYAREYAAFFEDELLGRCRVDYLIGAAHWVPHDGEWLGVHRGTATPTTLRSYAKYMVQSMESGLFTFMAHPDLYGNAYPVWDAEAEACARDILRAAAALGIPMEINAYGLRKPVFRKPDGVRPGYPWAPFWELAAEYDVTVVVTSDAHVPADVAGKVDEALAIAETHGLRLADLSQLQPASGARRDVPGTSIAEAAQ